MAYPDIQVVTDPTTGDLHISVERKHGGATLVIPANQLPASPATIASIVQQIKDLLTSGGAGSDGQAF